MMLYCICAAISLGIGGGLGGFQQGISSGSPMDPPMAALFLMLDWMSCVVAYGIGSYVADPVGLAKHRPELLNAFMSFSLLAKFTSL